MSTQSEDFLESLERTHVVLFHDGTEEKKQTEYGFIKKGLDKGQHCFYTTQNRQKILDEMKEFGIEDGGNNELLHIVEIPEKFEDYSDMILDKVKDYLKKPKSGLFQHTTLILILKTRLTEWQKLNNV